MTITMQRIILLRVLISWWFMPVLWLICLPIWALMFGWKDGYEIVTELSNTAWNGK